MAAGKISTLVWRTLPDPFLALKGRVLAALCVAYAGAAVAAQLLFPAWARETLSPLHLAIGLAVAIALAVSVVRNSVSAADDADRGYWLAATVAFAVLVALEVADIGLDDIARAGLGRDAAVADIEALAFALVGAGVLLAVLFVRRAGLPLLLALTSVGGFALFSAAGEDMGDWPVVAKILPPWLAGLALQVAMLACIEVFLVAVYLSGRRRAGAPQPQGLGVAARRLYHSSAMQHTARHPPVRAAYYPLLHELTAFAAMFYLLTVSGPVVRRMAGVPLWLQFRQLVRLWFRDGIDPPTYYAMELYRPANMHWVPDLLTRYETKNGLLAWLNNRRPNPNGVNEMSDKQAFARISEAAGVPVPRRLATVTAQDVAVHGAWTALAQDLFCKPQKGMGAKNTAAFSWIGSGLYADEHGRTLNLDEVFSAARAAGGGKAMMVQPWLRNADEIADLAKDSLITFRVVTCMNEAGEPEATLAMLRLLAKLEPAWRNLADEEYAAPIDLSTGRLGPVRGDNFRTVPIHMAVHPATGAAVEGRVLAGWPALRDAALKAHAAFPHRIVIGWDIALTPQGPVVLEGNSNFDVMFLQRVHMQPLGLTRLGDLMRFHMADHGPAPSSSASARPQQMRVA